MCGIAGVFGANPNIDTQKEQIKNMISYLQHRGPDGWGIYLSNKISLGQTRLSIIDLQSGHQPMVSDRYVIVYNGEIYNHIELRQQLKEKGINFKTKCDTEVVLKAFEVYGVDSFKLFNGQFALLIWDKVDQKLIIARDRYGIRPLYILNHKDKIYFASEMKTFDAIENYKREFNFDNLFEHALLWNTINDKTIYKNIRSLAAGTCEIYNLQSNDVKKIRYYQLGETYNPEQSIKADTGYNKNNEQQVVNEFSDLLENSVELRLRSDVPVGAYLSGGIDSSVITYLTDKKKSDIFKTFSVAFEDNEFDESNYQIEMASKIKTEHIEQKISYQLISENYLETIYHSERPLFRTAAVPLYLLSQKVHDNNIKVVLTGEAADEILFGYDTFKELKLLDQWSKNPDSETLPLIIKELYPHLQHYKDPKKYGFLRMYYEGFLNDYDNELVGLNIRASNNKAILNFFNKDYRPEFNKEKLLEEIKQALPGDYKYWSLLQKNQYMEMKTLLSGYLLSSQADRMSMAHSIEGRYPFLDHRLVEKVFNYDDNIKLNEYRQKYLLCKSYQNKIPDSIINRPKKPYTAPDLQSFYMNGKLSQQAEYFLSEEKILEYGVFDLKMVNRFLRKFTKGIPENIGYRDNMLISFILSTQMAKYWIDNKKQFTLNEKLKTVEIVDY